MPEELHRRTRWSRRWTQLEYLYVKSRVGRNQRRLDNSLNIFNHQTKVDEDNRFTVYGIRDLGTELSPITMLANSEFVVLLKQANTDSSKMAEFIGVSEAQLRFVTNTASGMGLIKCGSVVIPFDNQISKDTDLYRLYNTNIHEIIEQRKHANEKC